MTSVDSFAIFLQVIEIVWINLLLSGDNAVVIALACNGLPAEQRRMGILLGAGAAVIMRLIFTVLLVQMLGLPYLKLISGLLLLWIAVKLAVDQDYEANVRPQTTLWSAVWTIALADAVMSLDNVLAIAAAARGSFVLIAFGLALSIPLVIFGSRLVMIVLDRAPVLVWVGAGLLGWIAGELIAADPKIETFLTPLPGNHEVWVGSICTALVLIAAGIVHFWRCRGAR